VTQLSFKPKQITLKTIQITLKTMTFRTRTDFFLSRNIWTMSQVNYMHIHHLTLLVIFLPQSWYGRDKQMPTTGYSSQRPSACPCFSTSNFGIFKD